MRETKRLSPFFRLHKLSEVLSFSPGLSLVAFYGEDMGVKTSLHCSKGYRYSVEQNVNCL